MVARWFSVENINTKGCGCKFLHKADSSSIHTNMIQSIPMGFACFLFAFFCAFAASWDTEIHLRRV
jgi:hypothetical protein